MSLPPLREVIKEASLSARKSLGQNFILDLNVTRRIASERRPAGWRHRAGNRAWSRRFDARRFFLKGRKASSPSSATSGSGQRCAISRRKAVAVLRAIFADALKADCKAHRRRDRSEPDRRQPALQHRHAADRVMADGRSLAALGSTSSWSWFSAKLPTALSPSPATEAYGRLAVLAQYRARARILFTLPASVFTPPPKVASALVEIAPAPQLRLTPFPSASLGKLRRRRSAKDEKCYGRALPRLAWMRLCFAAKPGSTRRSAPNGLRSRILLRLARHLRRQWRSPPAPRREPGNEVRHIPTCRQRLRRSAARIACRAARLSSMSLLTIT